MASEKSDLTKILSHWPDADEAQRDQVMRVLYAELRSRAGQLMPYRDNQLGLQPTVLVNEAYLKMVGAQNAHWQGRGHFLALASKVMRQIIVDTVRREYAQKRDAGKVTRFATELNGETVTYTDVLLVEKALEELSGINAEYVQIVEARLFAGLTIGETALALDMSPATVKRKWAAAQVWLHERLSR